MGEGNTPGTRGGRGLKYWCGIMVLRQSCEGWVGLWREVTCSALWHRRRRGWCLIPLSEGGLSRWECRIFCDFRLYFILLDTVTGKNVLFPPLFVIVLFLLLNSLNLSFQCFVDLSPFSFVMLFKLDVHITPGTHASEHAGKVFSALVWSSFIFF